MLYIALLRGLNVPGRSVRMERLRGLFTELGLASVRSYIQSGNVFFESDETDRGALAARIGDHLERALGYEVTVCLRTVPELEALIALDPFKDVPAGDDIRRCVVFTTGRIAPDLALPMLSPKKDMEIIGHTDHDAFVVWHLVNGKAPAAKGFQEGVLGRDATTRFFHTVVKILAAARKGTG
ncbi:DUF1697 domain-containing protein [Streptomyces sp. 130]|uniref:DUF1697 domain-containing protein n=1 Tax=Streptomyces sp. 130 TaxID=2591006 RepID=UPI00117E392A|nr:DUF1697 domain-containing protein [Streptomyces sp. 130]TRV78031.1 DUF1697 domain-containing protein [Streptomyces sp. 130]